MIMIRFLDKRLALFHLHHDAHPPPSTPCLWSWQEEITRLRQELATAQGWEAKAHEYYDYAKNLQAVASEQLELIRQQREEADQISRAKLDLLVDMWAVSLIDAQQTETNDQNTNPNIIGHDHPTTTTKKTVIPAPPTSTRAPIASETLTLTQDPEPDHPSTSPDVKSPASALSESSILPERLGGRPIQNSKNGNAPAPAPTTDYHHYHQDTNNSSIEVSDTVAEESHAHPIPAPVADNSFAVPAARTATRVLPSTDDSSTARQASLIQSSDNYANLSDVSLRDSTQASF